MREVVSHANKESLSGNSSAIFETMDTCITLCNQSVPGTKQYENNEPNVTLPAKRCRSARKMTMALGSFLIRATEILSSQIVKQFTVTMTKLECIGLFVGTGVVFQTIPCTKMNLGSFQYCNLPRGFITQGKFTIHRCTDTGSHKSNCCQMDAKVDIKHVKNLLPRISESQGGSAIGEYFNEYVYM